jgi:hypothetical protein
MASVSSSCRTQHLGNAPGDLRHLERVREPGAVVVARRRKEHLRLVLQPSKGLAVNHAIAIALEHRPDRVRRLRAKAALARRALARGRRQKLEFPCFQLLTNG